MHFSYIDVSEIGVCLTFDGVIQHFHKNNSAYYNQQLLRFLVMYNILVRLSRGENSEVNALM